MIIPKLKVLKSHGQQYIPDLNKVELTEEFRGRPVLSDGGDAEALEEAAALCPTGAITTRPLTLDLGRCLFCGECARRAPKSIRFTNDYHLATTRREDLIVKVGQEKIPFTEGALRPEVRTIFKQSLKLREVSAGGDASVEMELNASGNVNFDFGRFGVEFTASPRHADGTVITGPISRNMAEPLAISHDSIAEPKVLILCGSEAISGGLFEKSRAVDRRFLEQHTVDLWVPGTPTHPMTFIDGVMNLLGRKKR